MNIQLEIDRLMALINRPMNAKEKTAIKNKIDRLKLALDSEAPTPQTKRSNPVSRDRRDNVKTQKPKAKKRK